MANNCPGNREELGNSDLSAAWLTNYHVSQEGVWGIQTWVQNDGQSPC